MQFGLVEMFQAMGPVAKAVSFLLIALSIISLYMLIERTLTYNKAKSKSREVAPKLADMMKNGQMKEALALASKAEYHGSHLARVTAAGITEFIEGKAAGVSFEEQIQSAERGCDRAASVFNQATIATSSPFIGLFGTISGIINAFKGMALTGSGGIGAVAGGIAEALVTTAFGIGVAIIALWCYNYLNTKIEVYDAEMANTTSQVIDFFVRRGNK
jgi:biopolymer transport protein ExbB/TolQ